MRKCSTVSSDKNIFERWSWGVKYSLLEKGYWQQLVVRLPAFWTVMWVYGHVPMCTEALQCVIKITSMPCFKCAIWAYIWNLLKPTRVWVMRNWRLKRWSRSGRSMNRMLLSIQGQLTAFPSDSLPYNLSGHLSASYSNWKMLDQSSPSLVSLGGFPGLDSAETPLCSVWWPHIELFGKHKMLLTASRTNLQEEVDSQLLPSLASSL